MSFQNRAAAKDAGGERFRLARLASVGRQEEKLNNSIKAKLHVVDVVAVVDFLFFFTLCVSPTIENICIFLPEDSLPKTATTRHWGQRGNSSPTGCIPFPASRIDCQVRQKMMVGSSRSRNRGIVPVVFGPASFLPP